MKTLLLRAAVGAAVVLLISLVSRGRNYFIAGLLPLFPSLALIAHYIVGSERSPRELRETALFGMWSLLPYFAYLAAVYSLSPRHPLLTTLAAATLAWLAVASVLLLAWVRLRGGAG